MLAMLGRQPAMLRTRLTLVSLLGILLEPAVLLASLAGLAAAGTGAWLEYTLVTRAAFNQGFALAKLPVRGARP